MLDITSLVQAKKYPDELRFLAEKASVEFLSDKKPLNETIKRMTKDHDLNPEQIQRVCELTNRFTHEKLYEKDRIVNFPVAVAQEIEEKPRPTMSKINISTIDKYIPGSEQNIELFPESKGENYPVYSTARDKMMSMIHQAEELMSQKVVAKNAAYMLAKEAFWGEVKKVLDENYTGADVIQALLPHTTNQGFLKKELQQAMEMYPRKGMIKAGKISTVRIPNEEHPLIGSYEKLAEAALDRARHIKALTLLQEKYRNSELLMKTAGPAAAAVSPSRLLGSALLGGLKGGKRLVERILLGAPAKAGPYAGKRIFPRGAVSEPGSWKDVTKAEIEKLTKEIPGRKDIRVLEGGGERVYQRMKARPGGLVGTVMKYPVTTGALGAGGVYLLSQRKKAQEIFPDVYTTQAGVY